MRRLFATGDVEAGGTFLMAAGAVSDFRCVREKAQIDGDSLIISKATAAALNVKVGDSVRCVAW
jgi:arginine/ornithine N-succinyltransferase beta subunit